MHDAPPPVQLFQMITGYWVSQITGTLAELGIADHLHAGVTSSADLAQKTGSNQAALYRVLRGAAAVGLLRETKKDQFALTETGALLRSNVPGSMREMAMAQSSPGHWLPWGLLRDAVKTGSRTTPAALSGKELFEWYGAHPVEGTAFSGAMANLTSLVAGDLASKLRFDGAKVADVGGANGTLLAAVLDATPSATGVLVDLPQVIEGAKTATARFGNRIELTGCDFFERVPSADTFLLKHVLHDWNDDQCAKLLQNCRAAGGKKSRAVIVEMMIADDGAPGPAPLMDVNMLVLVPGKERTMTEMSALLERGGYRVERMVPLVAGFTAIEAFSI